MQVLLCVFVACLVGALEVVAVDFGCCQVMDDEQCIADAQITGTPLYMAPETCEVAMALKWMFGQLGSW